MRRRVVRDIGTISGVVVILAAIVLVNGYMRRGTLAEQMVKARLSVEQAEATKGNSPLPWKVIQQTKGTRKTGPTFAPELLENKDKRVKLAGFMTPLYEFRNVKEFLFLPMPIECYFCATPPMRDVVLVQTADDVKLDIIDGPVVMDGVLTLNEGPGTKFFYVLKDAGKGIAPDLKHKVKKMTQSHIEEAQAAKRAEQDAAEPLLEPNEPPSTTPSQQAE